MNLLLIYGGSFLTAAIATAIAMPFWRRVFVRLGLVDEPGERKIHVAAVPLAGGAAVFTGIVCGLIVAALLSQLNLLPQAIHGQIAYGFERRSGQLAVLFLGAQAMLLLGILDDRWELPPL